MLTTRVIEGADWGHQLRCAWSELAASSATSTVFQTHAWVVAWWETLGRRRRPYVVEVREGCDLVGLFPLYRAGVTGRILRTMGTGPSDYLQPLARTGYETAVANALVSELGSARGVGLLDLQQVRSDQPLAAPFQTRPQAACWVLDLPSAWGSYVGSLSKSLRYDVRRGERSSRRLTIRRCDGEYGFRVLVDLHRRRWRSRGLPGVFFAPGTLRFHRRFLADAGRDAEIRVLELEGEPIGAIYLLHHGRTTFFYQSGMDPAAKRWSPGTLLIADAIRTSIDQGDVSFDFLRGDEAYKRRWKPRRIEAVRILHPVGDGFGRCMQHWHSLGHATGRLMRSGWARLGWGS